MAQLDFLDLFMQREKKMFKALKNNKIIAYNETGKFPRLVYDRIEEVEDAEMVEVGGEFVLKTDDKAIEKQKEEVRVVRNQYLETYVDPKQLVMVWNSLTAEEQELYKDYRQYLLDYPQTEGWYEQNPDDLKTFAEKRRKATETII